MFRKRISRSTILADKFECTYFKVDLKNYSMKLIFLAIVLVGLSVLGIAIKMFLVKDGKFTKTCGSIDPVSGKKIECTCGMQSNERSSVCDNK